MSAPSLSDAWWTLDHVRVYLNLKSKNSARMWLQRRGVRKCPTDRRLTCQAWIDAALNGRGKTNSVSTTTNNKKDK